MMLTALNPKTGKVLGFFGAALRMRLNAEVDIVVEVTPAACGDGLLTSRWPTPKVTALRGEEGRKPFRAIFQPCERLEAAIASLMVVPGGAATIPAWAVLSCFPPAGKQTVGDTHYTSNEMHALTRSWAPETTRMASNIVTLGSILDKEPLEGLETHQVIAEMIPGAWNLAAVAMSLFGGIKGLPSYDIPGCQVALNCLEADANNARIKREEYLARRNAARGEAGAKALESLIRE